MVGLKRFIHKCQSTSFFTRGHCPGKLAYHRVQGRGEFFIHLCTKCTVMDQ